MPELNAEEKIAQAIWKLDKFASWLSETAYGANDQDMDAFRKTWGDVRKKWQGIEGEVGGLLED